MMLLYTSEKHTPSLTRRNPTPGVGPCQPRLNCSPHLSPAELGSCRDLIWPPHSENPFPRAGPTRPWEINSKQGISWDTECSVTGQQLTRSCQLLAKRQEAWAAAASGLGKGKGTGAFSERVAALSGGLSSEQLNPRNARVAYWCRSWVALLAQVLGSQVSLTDPDKGPDQMESDMLAPQTRKWEVDT